MVQQITELLLCMYNKMTGGLADKIGAALTDALGSAKDLVDNVPKDGDTNYGAPTNPRVLVKGPSS